ncbi:MAG: LLM class flavin-dependent oxidoreductase [Streptosporangiales bacterium]|nr:LLM class flavin-dependent oxidoreductase [Streptosporangiales bacterium]
MRYAISIPQYVADGAFDPAALRDHLGRAEALGFESAWTQEQILGTIPHLGPVELLTYAAACNDRLRLGCSVFVTPLRNPVHLAKSLATLDQLSRGRLEVGIGTGGRNRPFGAFEVDPGTVVPRFTEGLRLMRELWTRQRVSFEGRFWQLADEGMQPKPFQKPGPPVWFGGSASPAVRRAARLADGFFGAGSTTTEAFAEQVDVLRAELTVQAHDAAAFPIAKRVYIAVDDDAERARDRLADALVGLYGEFGRRLLPVVVSGTPDDCVAGLREVAAAGAQLILVNPLFDDREQMERLAADVLPHVG